MLTSATFFVFSNQQLQKVPSVPDSPASHHDFDLPIPPTHPAPIITTITDPVNSHLLGTFTNGQPDDTTLSRLYDLESQYQLLNKLVGKQQATLEDMVQKALKDHNT